ncbi:hypothetical protein B0H13DRAFT_2518799 [Mycena leptocephala]|nr:hypothetical protein B0H13DRAFT_2518799 [Mycena leptocephala]
MVEANDDSFIFAKSLHAAQNFCLHMERFQFAYGWLTQWRKTYAYVLGDRDPARPERLSFPSVSIDPGVDPWTVKHYEVPVIRTGLDFLNAKVDDPGINGEIAGHSSSENGSPEHNIEIQGVTLASAN